MNGAGTIHKRSVVIAGHATSVSIESEFWEALREIAAARAVPINQLIAEIDGARTGNLSSAIRLFVLAELRARAAALGSRE
jgi:predicted DNA-binding ribbon-helix-helix protein